MLAYNYYFKKKLETIAGVGYRGFIRMSARAIGRKLQEIRKRLKKTRKQVIEETAGASKPSMHEVTLYKYETGILDPPAEFLAKFAKTYRVKLDDIKDAGGLGRTLRVAFGPYPDSAFFAAVARPGFLDRELGEPSLDVETKPVEYRDILEQVSKGGKAGGVDVAIHNENDFSKRRASYPGKILNSGSLLTYRGYAVLSTTFAGWKVFSQFYLLNNQRRRARKQRIVDSLRECLAQIEREAAGKASAHATGNSDRQSVLLELVKLALAHEQQDANEQYLNQLHSKTTAISGTDTEAFQQFRNALETESHEPAFFLGSLADRLNAEDLGAATLLNGDDLRMIAALDWPRLMKLFQPRNIVLVNSEAFDQGYDQIDAICRRWNKAVDRLHSSTEFSWISPLVDAQLKAYPHTLGTTENHDPHRDTEREDLFERIVREELIQFEHWTLRVPE